jgi:hypothetical protein
MTGDDHPAPRRVRAEGEGEIKTTARGPEIPNHHERQVMQHLEGSGSVKAFTVRSGTKGIENLLTKGWIEMSLIEGRLCYRVTDQGLTAKKMRV